MENLINDDFYPSSSDESDNEESNRSDKGSDNEEYNGSDNGESND